MRGASALRRAGTNWPWLGVAVSVAGALFLYQPFVLGAGNRFFDFLLVRRAWSTSASAATLDDPKRDPIVIVGYDDATSRDPEYGNKLPRAKLAQFLRRVLDAKAKAVAVDYLLIEPDSASTAARHALDSAEQKLPKRPETTKTIEELKSRFDADAELAAEFADPRVIAAYGLSPNVAVATSSQVAALQAERLQTVGGECEGAVQSNVSFDAPRLFEAQQRHGNILIEADNEDQVVRTYALFSRVGGSEGLYPSLGLAAGMAFFEGDEDARGYVTVRCSGKWVSGVQWGASGNVDAVISDDGRGRAYLDFTGRFDQMFPNTLSMRAVLSTNQTGGWLIPDERFAGKVVFFGPRSYDVDVYHSATEVQFSGTGIHALVARSFIDRKWLHRAIWLEGVGGGGALPLKLVEALLAVILGIGGVLFLALLGERIGLWIASYGLALPIAGYLVSAEALRHGYLFNGFFPGIIGFLAFFVSFGARFVVEQSRAKEERLRAEDEARRADEVRSRLGRFLPPSIAELAVSDPPMLLPARREITILFSDIRGFTTFAESISSEELSALLNDYLTRMTVVLHASKGTLDKYIGDAIMGLFGAPANYEDHPGSACRAALLMMEILEVMQAEWRKAGKPVLDIGIGVNTGLVTVGMLGGKGVPEQYTALGDEVNFASRLEGLNKFYGTHVLVGARTRTRAGEGFVFRDLGLVQVKGKHKAVRIYELVGEGKAPDWLEPWDAAIAAFLKRDWDAAEAGFQAVTTRRLATGGEGQPVSRVMQGDPPSAIFLEFIREFRRVPPGPDWEGTIERHEK